MQARPLAGGLPGPHTRVMATPEGLRARPPAPRPIIGGDRDPHGSSLSSRAVASPEDSGEALPRHSGTQPGVTVEAPKVARFGQRGVRGDAGGTRHHLTHLRVM